MRVRNITPEELAARSKAGEVGAIVDVRTYSEYAAGHIDGSTLGVRRRMTRGKAGDRIRTLLPAAFRSHLKASIREGLLPFESLFDEAVKALEKEGHREPPGRKGRKIKVQ